METSLFSARSKEEIIFFIKGLYGDRDPIPLSEPHFQHEDRINILNCLDSTLVSSVGPFVDAFERELADICGTKHAIAVVNGTSALFAALYASGVGVDTEVITQSLTFVATANAIRHCGGHPVFLDVDRKTLGLCPEQLRKFLTNNCTVKRGNVINRQSGRCIKAVVPMHTFGHPCRIIEIAKICEEFEIALIEDAAESLGSTHQGRSMGTFGKCGVISFNGNKIVTTGGGGAIITDDDVLALYLRHITKTAKVPHPYEFIHDEVGYNLRMPNINAALGYDQLKRLEGTINERRRVAAAYDEFFHNRQETFIAEPIDSRSNYWLSAVLMPDPLSRNELLEKATKERVLLRPVWRPMHMLPMYSHCERGVLIETEYLYPRLINLPSSSLKPRKEDSK